MSEHIHHHFESDNADASGANVFLVVIVLIAMLAGAALLYLYASGNLFQERNTTIDVTIPAAGVPAPAQTAPGATPQDTNF